MTILHDGSANGFGAVCCGDVRIGVPAVEGSEGRIRGGGEREGPVSDGIRALPVHGSDQGCEGALPEGSARASGAPRVGDLLDAVGEYASHASLWDRRAEKGEDVTEAERLARASFRQVVRLAYWLAHGREMGW